jgi:PAS domain S-box-containing protein
MSHVSIPKPAADKAAKADRTAAEQTSDPERGRQLLLTLSQAAQAVQRACSAGEINKIVSDELDRLGYRGAIFTLTDFVETVSEAAPEAVSAALPESLRPLAVQAAKLFGAQHTLHFPLFAGEAPFGILSITGSELSEADAPAFAAFASQVSIALDNLRVSEETRQRPQLLQRIAEQAVQIAFQAKLIDSALSAIVASDADFHLIAWNAAAESMYGWKAEEVMGRNALDVVQTEFPGAEKAQMLQIIADCGRYRGEATQVRKDGTRFPVEVSSTVLRDEQGRITSYVSVNRDITERKQADATLRESEDKFRHFFESSNVGKSITQVSGEIRVNRAFCEMLGYSLKELQGGKWQEITHPDDIELTQQQIDILISGEKDTVRFTKRYLKKDGSVIWADASTSLRRDEAGMPMYFMTALVDITERRRVEQKLEEERILLRTLIDNLPDLIYVKDLQGRKIISNIADWQASGGKTMEDILGKTDLETYPPELAEEYWAIDRRVMDSGISILNREEPGLDSQGNPVWILSSKVPLRDSQGRVIGLVGVGRDITELKRVAEEIRQLNAELEQRVEERTRELREAQEQIVRQEKLAVLGQLAGGVAHELRNPLGSISNAVYYLKLVQPEANEKIRQYHAIIENEVHNAVKIITDLLDFSRIKYVDREAVSVPELVRRVLERFPAPPSVEVLLDLPDDLPKVFADWCQMEQVLGNLIVNACQIMRKGGRLTISAGRQKPGAQLPVAAEDSATENAKKTTRSDQGTVAIAVKDSGEGILPENMAKLFEPLFTTKLKGIGLGLAVSKKLVEANGGRIVVESEPGKGSTFTVYLPVHE